MIIVRVREEGESMADKVHCIRKTLRLMPEEAKMLAKKACDNRMNEAEYTRYCQGTKLNTQDTLKSISKEIGFFYFDLKSELSRQRLKFKSKDGN